MKTLYLDCSMGAAGDMLTAALLELLPDPDAFVAELNALGIPGVRWQRERMTKKGVAGTYVSVLLDGEEESELLQGYAHAHGHDHTHTHEHTHEHARGHGQQHEHEHAHDHAMHHHSDLHWIEHIVQDLPVSEKVKGDILAVYHLIAEAESTVHGVPVSEIHFHEVGSLDAVADVTAVCLLMERLAPDAVIASPVCVGYGLVRCAHGVLPVPAPATSLLLKDVPIDPGDIEGELCTPTGAALIRHFVGEFGPLPAMRISSVGYGCGKKDFPRANFVRALFGESEKTGASGIEAICELSCTLDDMTAEEIGFAMERLFAGGAREVYTVPVGMKKNRPGTLLRVLCRSGEREKMAALIFKHTSTIGICAAEMERLVLERHFERRETPYGPVQVKASSGFGVKREKLEYEDLARIAREQDLSLAELRAFLSTHGAEAHSEKEV